MTCKDIIRYSRLILLDIFLSSFNLVLTFINIHLFLTTEGKSKYGLLSLFFLWLPGIVTSGGFLVLYFRDVKAVSNLQHWKLVVYPLCLLVLYPVLPVALTILHIIKGEDKLREMASLARLFASFLDHGPQFVLRVVVVVLNGMLHRGLYNKDDVLFVVSMISSFLSLVLAALFFNERKSRWVLWFFISGPMFSAIYACRAFTLAVFLREMLQDGAPAYLQFICVFAVLMIILINFGLFRLCGQDWIRSIVFSVSSVLLPVGYNNDNGYYQLPNQNLVEDKTVFKAAPRLRREAGAETTNTQQILSPVTSAGEGGQVEADADSGEAGKGEAVKHLVPMKSGKYLLLHTVVSTILLGSCSLYIYFSSDLDPQADEALVIPQILGVIPGFFFAVGRCVLHDDICPTYEDDTTRTERACGICQRGVKVFLAVVFAIIGFASIVPALLWTFVYKIIIM